MTADHSVSRDAATPTQRAQLDALTGLRFIAALHVLLFHEARGLFGVPTVENLVGTGYIGVQLFFVLSGFILAYTYSDGHLSRVERRSFLVARFARVYPVYALALFVALPQFATWAAGKIAEEQLMGATKVVVAAISNVLLAQAWLVPTVSQWNAPGWSLSVEAGFYVVFPLILAALVRLERRRLLATLLIVWLLSLVPPLLYDLRFPGSSHNDPGMLLAALKYLPLTRVGEFIIGVGTGILFLRARATRWPGGLVAFWSAALIVGILASGVPIPYPFLHNALFAPLFAVMVLALAGGQGWVARALGARWLVLLGQASYAMYLLHEPLAWLLYKNEYGPLRTAAHWPRFLIYVAVVTAVSVLVFRYWEEPLRRAIRGVRRAHAPRVAPDVQARTVSDAGA